MDKFIAGLDDGAARGILATVARSRLHSGAKQLGWTHELRRALGSAFEVTPAAKRVSESELAREALLLLAEDPGTREAIAAMAEQASEGKQQYDAGATIGVTVAVLVILQSHIRFERDKKGQWALRVEKKPTSERLLKPLVEKLLSFTPGTR